MTFARVRALIPYLCRLGVSHLYLSPVLQARTGSAHGYDGVDPTRVDAALGGERGLERLAREARRAGLGLVIDIVPNHLAAHEENPFFEQVLARGPAAPSAPWFDIEWQQGPLLLPILGAPLRDVMRRRELVVRREDGESRLRYHDRSLPLAPESEGLPLPALLQRQHYRLGFWRRARHRLNYRRFFDVNELIGVRVEDSDVFRATHAKLLSLVADGQVDGLRVDHVDGLRDPRGYLERLRREVDALRPARGAGGVGLWVEKILASWEPLPADWPVDGTTGYEFLNEVEDLWLDPAGVTAIERAWQRRSGERESFDSVALRAKRVAVIQLLRADLERLLRAAGDASSALRDALVEVVAALPVYRTYAGPSGRLGRRDRALLDETLRRARAAGRAPPEKLRRLRRLLGLDGRPPQPEFVALFQQVTGPAAAKGIEDTALYRSVALVSRNEVGSDPGRPPSDALAAFHRSSRLRARRWPRSLLAVTTHDTKRSADVRARLDVLSEIPERWLEAVERWTRGNAARRSDAGPDADAEYLFYQSLLGLWPLRAPGARSLPSRPVLAELAERLVAYMHKAAREAKQRTSWISPDPVYEAVLERFVRRLLDPERAASRRFLADVQRLCDEVSRPGLWNGLSRTLLHLTAPGVPDLYQGDELWSLSLVDPDNRRRVDFARRARLLRGLERGFGAGPTARRRLLAQLVARPEDGRIKLHVVHAALEARRRSPELFVGGDYRPLRAEGAAAAHVVAYARRAGARVALVVVPRRARTLLSDGRRAPLGVEVWGATSLRLPRDLAGRAFTSPLTGARLRTGAAGPPRLALGDLLAELPVGLWLGRGRAQTEEE
jgi:malto-oligosyltrehalose synthase